MHYHIKNSAMCLISLDREKNKLFFDILFVCSPQLDPEISPFCYNSGRPLVSILNSECDMGTPHHGQGRPRARHFLTRHCLGYYSVNKEGNNYTKTVGAP